jgi:hypothetical protein
MKFLFVFFFVASAFGCSESAKIEFKVTEKTSKACIPSAKDYVMAVGAVLIKNEAVLGKNEVIQGPFKLDNDVPVPYRALGNAKKGVVGYNIGITSANGWQCNYCVDMGFSEDGSCRLNRIFKHMCAKLQ